MTEQEVINVLEKYREVPKSEVVKDAFTMAISALEKQIAKKPINREGTTYFYCPICKGNRLNDYCADCGQALEWSDSK